MGERSFVLFKKNGNDHDHQQSACSTTKSLQAQVGCRGAHQRARKMPKRDSETRHLSMGRHRTPTPRRLAASYPTFLAVRRGSSGGAEEGLIVTLDLRLPAGGQGQGNTTDLGRRLPSSSAGDATAHPRFD